MAVKIPKLISVWYTRPDTGDVAQLVERFHGMEEAVGSNPIVSTTTNSDTVPIGIRIGRLSWNDGIRRAQAEKSLETFQAAEQGSRAT